MGRSRQIFAAFIHDVTERNGSVFFHFIMIALPDGSSDTTSCQHFSVFVRLLNWGCDRLMNHCQTQSQHVYLFEFRRCSFILSYFRFCVEKWVGAGLLLYFARKENSYNLCFVLFYSSLIITSVENREPQDMISKLLIVDQAQRLTARQALQHPWFEAADGTLAGRDLRDNLQELQVFNAKRKMRAAIQSVRPIVRPLPSCVSLVVVVGWKDVLMTLHPVVMKPLNMGGLGSEHMTDSS